MHNLSSERSTRSENNYSFYFAPPLPPTNKVASGRMIFSWRRAANNIVLGGRGGENKKLKLFSLRVVRKSSIKGVSNSEDMCASAGMLFKLLSLNLFLFSKACVLESPCPHANICPHEVVHASVPFRGFLFISYTSCDVFQLMLIFLYILQYLTVLLRKKKGFFFSLKEL